MATSPKKQLFENFALVAKALASANRLELLEALAQGERGVEGLAKASGMSVANTSHHLQLLRSGGLVKSRRDGNQIIYSLTDDNVLLLLAGIRYVAEQQLAEVERIVRENFDSRDNLTPVRRDELLGLVKSGEATVIDVRPSTEYNAGHIEGAVNIPLESLPKWLSKLPHDQEIVAYCRGPYCMLSFEAVEQLRKHGYRARRLEDGFPEWKVEHLPVGH
ncbi:MAG TPA: metalloregulator ArsR/SmtB family transcription factor [Gallionellaceae bacterium]|nr:metalloregulator ArsR/SmtB family transcription factor [Gallionellaceae bacterium]